MTELIDKSIIDDIFKKLKANKELNAKVQESLNKYTKKLFERFGIIDKPNSNYNIFQENEFIK